MKIKTKFLKISKNEAELRFLYFFVKNEIS